MRQLAVAVVCFVNPWTLSSLWPAPTGNRTGKRIDIIVAQRSCGIVSDKRRECSAVVIKDAEFGNLFCIPLVGGSLARNYALHQAASVLRSGSAAGWIAGHNCQ
jgi:hypothetical protein